VNDIDTVVDQIDLIKGRCIDVISNVDDFNIDNPMFAGFQTSLPKFFDMLDNVVSVASGSNNDVLVNNVYKLIKNLHDVMMNIIDVDGVVQNETVESLASIEGVTKVRPIYA
jgi:hypothetical protein